VNGWYMHLTPDGKRLMMVGGGGWRPKGEGTGGGYVTALFSTANLKAMVGQVPSGLTIAFHPVLPLCVINGHGLDLTLFNSRSLALRGKIPLSKKEERRPFLLTFGGKGTRVIVWNGEDIKNGQGLTFVQLDSSAADRAALERVYGRLPPPPGR